MVIFVCLSICLFVRLPLALFLKNSAPTNSLSLLYIWMLKWSGSLYLSITKVLAGISGITKIICFFPFEGLWEEKLWFLCVLTDVECNEILADCFLAVKQLHYTSVRAHKNQSFSSHRPSNGKKIMFFVIPEMPSKTFVMVLKNLPYPFNSINLASPLWAQFSTPYIRPLYGLN